VSVSQLPKAITVASEAQRVPPRATRGEARGSVQKGDIVKIAPSANVSLAAARDVDGRTNREMRPEAQPLYCRPRGNH
jgi:hypothetical protein